MAAQVCPAYASTIVIEATMPQGAPGLQAAVTNRQNVVPGLEGNGWSRERGFHRHADILCEGPADKQQHCHEGEMWTHVCVLSKAGLYGEARVQESGCD